MPKGMQGFKKGNKTGSKTRFKSGHAQSNSGRTHFKKGMKPCNWKGKYTNSGGYIYVFKPEHPFSNKQGYIFEHRLVVESQIGRYLKLTETTHHLGKKDDNVPENLMAFASKSAHVRFHHNPDNVKPSEIIFDGRHI